MTDTVNRTNIDVIAPCFWCRPLPDSERHWRDAVDDIVGIDEKIHLKLTSGSEHTVLVRVIDQPEEHEGFYKEYGAKPISAQPSAYYIFSVDVQYSNEEAMTACGGENVSTANACYLYEQYLADDFLRLVTDVGLAANIAWFGSFNARQFYSFINSNVYSAFSKYVYENSPYKYNFRSDTNYLRQDGVGVVDNSFIGEEIEKQNWPPITKLNVLDVFMWLKGMEGFDSGVAKSKLGIAYAAFSFMMGDPGSSSKSKLVWALMGLEALYCKGGSGLREQLVSKTEVFLGERITHKKSFGKMYDYRSRLMHGDVNLVYRHNQYDGSRELNEFDSEFSNAEQLAISVLLSTLQKLCMLNIYELKFTYAVNT